MGDSSGFVRVSTVMDDQYTTTNKWRYDADKVWDEEWEKEWERLAGPYAEEATFTTLLTNIRANLHRNTPDEVILQALMQVDSNNDGLISKEEFFAIKENTPPSGVLQRLVRQAAWCAVPVSERDLEKRRAVENISCWPPRVFILTVSLAQIAAFVYYAVDMDLPTAPMSPCPTYSPLVYDPARRYEAWRYLSYMLIHSGWLHIVSNLITQLMFGLILELVHGPVRLCGIYLAGVVCGALATSVSTPYSFLAGASGGVYAVQYAHVANLIINWDELLYPLPQAVVITLITVVDMGYSTYDLFFTATPSHTGHVAHIGGAICGLLLGICLLKNIKQIDWERYCKIGSAILLAVLVLTIVFVNCFATSYFPEPDYRSVSEVRHNWMIVNHMEKYFLGR